MILEVRVLCQGDLAHLGNSALLLSVKMANAKVGETESHVQFTKTVMPLCSVNIRMNFRLLPLAKDKEHHMNLVKLLSNVEIICTAGLDKKEMTRSSLVYLCIHSS
jgi:hypothetical protein